MFKMALFLWKSVFGTKGKNMMKRSLLIFLAAACLGITACSANKDTEPMIELESEEENKGFVTVAPEYGDVVKSVKITCTYQATEQEDLYLKGEGLWIETLNVKTGDIVEKGELLFMLSVEHLEEEIEELEYEIDSISLKLAHIREMEAFELSSREFLYSYTGMTEDDKKRMKEELEEIKKAHADEIRELEDALYITQKKLEQCKQDYDEGFFRAGINGVVTYLEESVQYRFFSSDKEVKVVTISNLDSCYFVAQNTEYADYFREADSVTITCTDSGAQSYCEAVPALVGQWDEKMYFKPAGDEIYDFNQTGNIVVELEKRENVLCIPNAALHESEEGFFVYVSEEGILNMRYVTVGLCGSELTEITGGLTQEDTILLRK